MDPKSDEGIFLGYSINSRAYRVYNKHTKMMMESINVVINDTLEENKEDQDDVSLQQTNVLAGVLAKRYDIESESTNYENPQVNKGLSIIT